MLSNNMIGCLLERMAGGDRKALEILWHETKEDVYSFILTYLADRQLAEDALQETFISIFKGAAGFRRNVNGRAWILTIAKNNAVSLIRKRKEFLMADEDMAEFPDEGRMESLLDITDEVDRLLDSMDDISRRIIILHAVNDLKHSEVAAILNLPLGTVYRRYSVGMKKLRKINENSFPGGKSYEKRFDY